MRGKDPAWMYVVVVAIAATVFAADLGTPPGYNTWILFIPALILCKLFTWRPLVPVALAALLSALIVAGYFLQPYDEPELLERAPINRGIGIATLFLLGGIGRQFVLHRIRLATQDWLDAGLRGLSLEMQGEQRLQVLGEKVLSFLAEYLDAQVGALYAVNGGGSFAHSAGFARAGELVAGGQVFAPGEGLIGQAAVDERAIVVNEVPEGYVQVRSGVGAAAPRSLVLLPTRAGGEVNGVLELGFFSAPSDAARALLDALAEPIGVALRSAMYRARQAELLEETQRQAEELQAQQEELQAQNEELEAQARVLKASQLELERASRYKSEFLANMSHELRTPLNSSLILAKLLVDNRGGNLSPEQIKYAESIYSAGNDLLGLINDILDLSKIEAGKIDLNIEPVLIGRLVEDLQQRFEPLAAERKLDLRVTVEPGCPGQIETDPQRLRQISTNLLSNALKFTERGSIHLRVGQVDARRIALTVEDTGIGIPAEQHEVIFEAFRQADGTTNRRYGGTGLGLSICRELVKLLGGEIRLRSAPGEGSAFAVLLPIRSEHAVKERRFEPGSRPDGGPRTEKSDLPAPFVEDDRDRLEDRGRVVLIAEDDGIFALILRDLGREHGFQCVIARGCAEGLALARRYRPVAILLDIGLPDHSGLTVLELLKRDPSTRHVPIHVVSVHDYQKVARELGAIGYALKPVKREQLEAAFRLLEERASRTVKAVLVVEDDALQRDAITKLLQADGVDIVGVATADAALERLRGTTFDCCVLDLMLPDVSGFELLERMSKDESCAVPPVIIYTARPLTLEEEQRLRRSSSSIIVKGARSPERLLEEVTLFLHKVEAELPAEQRRMLEAARDRERIFDGRSVLLVEDDVRSIFALTRVLEPRGLSVQIARNGREALTALASGTPIDLVLMDIMMPEMDGLTATREIRKDARWVHLPIIALTAKAMIDDRAECLAAGANDYIAKPIDVDKLLSLLRVWMPR